MSNDKTHKICALIVLLYQFELANKNVNTENSIKIHAHILIVLFVVYVFCLPSFSFYLAFSFYRACHLNYNMERMYLEKTSCVIAMWRKFIHCYKKWVCATGYNGRSTRAWFDEMSNCTFFICLAILEKCSLSLFFLRKKTRALDTDNTVFFLLIWALLAVFGRQFFFCRLCPHAHKKQRIYLFWKQFSRK